MAKLPRPPDDFYGRPRQFSFKDLLAIAFSAIFFYVVFRALKDMALLDLVKTLVPLIGIILGGYFGQEIAATWMDKPQQPERRESYYEDTGERPPI